MSEDFWKRLDELIATSEIIIDRPKGTPHPNAPEVVYPVDYGYLKDTVGADGNEIDIWSGTDADRKLTAIACTVDILKRDTEFKLIYGCSDEEILLIEDFHNNRYMSDIILKREDS